ncbi:MAG: DNA topoisomerase IV [Flavobacterium sp.]
MKKLLILPLFVLLISCFEAEHNCKDFKTGTFEFVSKINGVEKKSTFTRTETMQIETYEGKTDTADIRWVNDCEYILQKRHPKNMEEKKAIDMKILGTTKNSYTFEFGIVGSDKKQTGTVTKISDEK